MQHKLKAFLLEKHTCARFSKRSIKF